MESANSADDSLVKSPEINISNIENTLSEVKRIQDEVGDNCLLNRLKTQTSSDVKADITKLSELKMKYSHLKSSVVGLQERIHVYETLKNSEPPEKQDETSLTAKQELSDLKSEQKEILESVDSCMDYVSKSKLTEKVGTLQIKSDKYKSLLQSQGESDLPVDLEEAYTKLLEQLKSARSMQAELASEIASDSTHLEEALKDVSNLQQTVAHKHQAINELAEHQ